MSFLSGLKNFFLGSGGGSKGLDPTTLLLGGLGLLGGDQGQEMQSFHGTGHTDPVQSLQEALGGINRLGQGLTERAPVQLRSSYVQAPPSPISIPGLGFQIGGGLGRDPALDDPSLLVAQDRGNPAKYDPFQSLAPQKQTATPQPTARRKPGQ